MSSPSFADTYSWALRAAQVRSANAVALRRVSPDDLEDLVQEALLAVLNALPSYDSSRASVRTFVETVVAHRIASMLRSHRRRPAVVPINEDHDVEIDGGSAHDLRMDVRKVLSDLPESDQRVAALLMEESPSEAGRTLGLARSTIYMRIRRLREAFAAAGYSAARRCE
ncbi:MAG: sigma-70 family RNA polymerase sigma factor [Bryobacteraceae bacterium]|nr:sigma-70 family RNA polymerase sigma factor [Bryobacteraceae bacterium]